MNARKSKQIRKKALHLLVEWIQSQVPESEADKININNVQRLMPPDTHIYANQRLILSAYSFKWIIKNIKKIIKIKNININNILLQDIKDYNNNYTYSRRDTNYII